MEYGCDNQYCPRCNSNLVILLKYPVVLRCVNCEDRFIIPNDMLEDYERVQIEIEAQYVAHEIFVTESQKEWLNVKED